MLIKGRKVYKIQKRQELQDFLSGKQFQKGRLATLRESALASAPTH
jgi:hypothetical protein